jgi:hypothetical protein
MRPAQRGELLQATLRDGSPLLLLRLIALLYLLGFSTMLAYAAVYNMA